MNKLTYIPSLRFLNSVEVMMASPYSRDVRWPTGGTNFFVKAGTAARLIVIEFPTCHCHKYNSNQYIALVME